ncbi:UTP6 protein, partial [Polypterus senegalus]|nr:UTP6 protein [Polypterus senegalus]
MAEVIQQRIEDRIPELEQLERVGLFTPTERIRYHFKREEIEYPIIQRIYDVFKRATSKWKATKKQLSKVFSSVLAIHPDKTGISGEKLALGVAIIFTLLYSFILTAVTGIVF